MADPYDRVTELRDRVGEREKELEAAVHELKVAARRAVGPAQWVRQSPLPFIAAALVFGWWLGGRSLQHRRGMR